MIEIILNSLIKINVNKKFFGQKCLGSAQHVLTHTKNTRFDPLSGPHFCHLYPYVSSCNLEHISKVIEQILKFKRKIAY